MVYTIGISGPSCSGKSTLAQTLAMQTGACVVLEQDWFFRSMGDCPTDANFCDLKYLDVDAFVHVAEILAAGGTTKVPIMDFKTFECVGAATIISRNLLVIEGMTIFRIPKIVSLCKRRYYLAPPFDTIARRKRSRDLTERAKSADTIEAQLLWMAEEYRRDLETSEKSDFALLQGDNFDELVHQIICDAGVTSPSLQPP